MGFNTVVVMFNDHSSDWPEDMRAAARSFRRNGADFGENGYFSSGTVVSVDHADHRQVVVAGGNTGTALSAVDAARPEDLDALAEILRAHGYAVRWPKEKRARPPHKWGHWGRNSKSGPAK